MELIRVFPMPGQATGGNPAPVWLAADALSADEMQARTRESGHESVFVLRPSDDAHDLRMRYFVPRHEMEMCGHATIGALWLLHERGEWDGAPVTIQTLSGSVQGRRVDGMVEISQPRAEVQAVDEALRSDIARCLGIAPDQIVGAVLNASTSRVKTLIRLPSVEALHALKPDFTQVEALCERLGSTGLYPYALAQDAFATVSARQFPKSSGYPEDAATGIAAAALAWGMRHVQAIGDEATLVTVRQGEAMGSASTIFVRLPRAEDGGGCWLRGDARAMASDPPRSAVAAARPSGLYARLTRAGGLLYSSGVVGRIESHVVQGILAGADDVGRGQAAAMAAVNAILSAVEDEIGSLAGVSRVVSLTGYLQTKAGFTHHVAVMDAASAVLNRTFPDAPLPVRTTVGVASLPFGGVVEVSMVFELSED